MTYQKDPRVDTYLDALPAWQQDVLRDIRAPAQAEGMMIGSTLDRSSPAPGLASC